MVVVVWYFSRIISMTWSSTTRTGTITWAATWGRTWSAPASASWWIFASGRKFVSVPPITFPVPPVMRSWSSAGPPWTSWVLLFSPKVSYPSSMMSWARRSTSTAVMMSVVIVMPLRAPWAAPWSATVPLFRIGPWCRAFRLFTNFRGIHYFF